VAVEADTVIRSLFQFRYTVMEASRTGAEEEDEQLGVNRTSVSSEHEQYKLRKRGVSNESVYWEASFEATPVDTQLDETVEGWPYKWTLRI